MLHLYSGNVVTDEQGHADVVLPPYFDGLNRDVRYQLTVVGQWAHAIVLEEVKDNRFVIATDKPHVKVSWLVTALRDDAYMHEHPWQERIARPDDYDRGVEDAKAHAQQNRGLFDRLRAQADDMRRRMPPEMPTLPLIPDEPLPNGDDPQDR